MTGRKFEEVVVDGLGFILAIVALPVFIIGLLVRAARRLWRKP